MKEKIRLEATELYFAFLAMILGRYAFEGGGRRRLRQRLQKELQAAVDLWIENHPKVQPALRERVLAIHEDFFRNVDTCRDHFERRD